MKLSEYLKPALGVAFVAVLAVGYYWLSHRPRAEEKETPGQALESPPQADDMIRQMATTLEAREAEISNLRDLLHHGVDTIESHTLMDSDGTVVMHGDYQYISATAIEQWLERAEAALNPARRSTERAR